MSRGLYTDGNTEQFLERANLKHNFKFSYDLTSLRFYDSKIEITCPVHGKFEQKANEHLVSEFGCRSCSFEKMSLERRVDTKSFIEKARSVHGDKYDYSQSNYVLSRKEVRIGCPAHGWFNQTPNNHLRGQNCGQCRLSVIGKWNQSTKQTFVTKARAVHSDLYDYSGIIYDKDNIKVNIRCYKHGIFEQTPNAHLQGAGCPSCKCSRGENVLRAIFDKNEVKFIPEYTIPEAGNRYRYDFYLQKYNTLVEFHGVQHFEPVPFFGGEKALKRNILRDELKEGVAKLLNYRLFVVTYKDLLRSEEELEELVLVHLKKAKEAMEDKVVKNEVRFAVHLPRTNYRDDAHYVRLDVTHESGKVVPKTVLLKDMLRPVWCSKAAYRGYKDKREFAPIEELNERMTTQSDINTAVAGLLESPYMANQPNAIKNSPYVYGYDQTSTSLIKLKNLETNNFIQSPYTVAVMDIETDILTKEILIATVVFESKVHVTLSRKYLGGRTEIDAKVDAGVKRYLPQYHGKLKIKITVHDDEVGMLKAVFKTANDWAPVFLSFWNISFDVVRILERLKLFNVNPVDVICDQSIPRAYRYCHYKEGPTKKEMASGKKMPIKPSMQWHTLFSTTKFHVIDAMCVYRQIRIAKQELPSYSLDAILQKELGSRKLKFEEAEAYKGAKWHMFMQQEYPIEYIVYNIYDCLGVLELDKVTKDLSMSLPSGAGMTDFSRFNSNPKKIVDALYIFAKERGRIVGTVPKIEKEEAEVEADELGEGALEIDDDDEDDPSKYKSLDLKGWIQLLPQNLLLSEGLKCLEDFPEVVTNVRGTVWDVDATAAYPTCTMVANVSKETCVNELIQIDGVSEEVFREQNLSMCLGGVNTLEYFSVMFGMPTIEQIDQLLED